MPTDPKRIQAVFRAVIQSPDPAARDTILDRECADDPELRQHVVTLLHIYETPPSERGLSSAQQAAGTFNMNSDEVEEFDLGLLEPSTKPDVLGRLGHYEILQVVGRGAFGTVLKAFDETLHRVVAIKIMSPTMAATSPARKRFLREARAAAAVRHENVVQIYAVVEHPIPYLVMEYIPGESLQERLDRNGPLDLRDILNFGSQIARGLAAAHEMGLIHRDIKPANILVESGIEPRVKLSDFGLARTVDDASLSQSGMVIGTPLYMAPEQASGDAIDQRADLFSLGSVLYVMVCGRPPFRATSALTVLQRVREDTPRPIGEIIPETPQWLSDIVARLLAKDPSQRFQSAREVAELLADCLAKLERNEKVRLALPAPQPRPRATSRWWRWASAAAVLLGLLAVSITEATGLTHLLVRPTTSAAPGPSPAPVEEGLPPRFKNRLGMQFALIPRGQAWLGGGNDEAGDRGVTIEQDFYLGVYEATQGEWESLMGTNRNPSEFSRNGPRQADVANLTDEEIRKLPVERVSWNDCQEFLRKVNAHAGDRGWVYRLPTSNEWEYACRGGPTWGKDADRFEFYLDTPTNTLTGDRANIKDSNRNRTSTVGTYPPNRLGLHDMHGNVFEWCNDRPPNGEDPTVRILRGGGWMDQPFHCRARHIGLGNDSPMYTGAGLRVARVPAEK
jgi:serine/threonine protein kinase/formylglycine-generating enzyme required for sulfatase activity